MISAKAGRSEAMPILKIKKTNISGTEPGYILASTPKKSKPTNGAFLRHVQISGRRGPTIYPDERDVPPDERDGRSIYS